MGYVEKRGRRYRARYRDPLGRQRSKSFTLKADADRFVREMDVSVERGSWLDPRTADIPVAEWAKEFLALRSPAVSDDPPDLPPGPRKVRRAAVRRVPHRPIAGR